MERRTDTHLSAVTVLKWMDSVSGTKVTGRSICKASPTTSGRMTNEEGVNARIFVLIEFPT